MELNDRKIDFWPRGLLKDPKRSFVVVVLLVVVGMDTLVKNGTKTEQKNVREQNLLQIEQKMGTKSVREQKILAMKIAPNWAQKRDFKVI